MHLGRRGPGGRRASVVTLDHHRGSEENQPGWEWHDATLVDPPHRPARDAAQPAPDARGTPASTTWSACSSRRTQQVAGWWSTPLSLLFLDGNHTEEVAQHDYAAFAPHLVPGGLLLVHDVFPDPADGGQPPWHVVQRAEREGFEPVSSSGSLRVLRRPRPGPARRRLPRCPAACSR